ncbi:MAG: tetratricopeptide repeat protein [Silvibacterium sp.]
MRRVIALTIVFAAAFSLGRAQSPHLAQGAADFRQGDFNGALTEFRAAQSESPHDATIMNLIGITETKLGQIDEANEEYKKAIAADPALLAPHKNLAVNYLAAARYREAESQLNTALKLNSSDPFLHAYLAQLYLATARDKEAVQQLEPATSLIESNPALLYGMIMACLRLNDDAKALPLIAAGEHNSFFTVEQEYQIALLLTAHKQYAAATERFRQIVKAAPDSWSAKEDLAISLLNENKQQEAIPVLEQLTQQRASDANVWALLGSAYELSGNQPQSLDAYRAAVAADPANPDRYLDYARLLMDMDRYDEAAQIVQAGIAHTSDPYALNIRKGSIQMLQGDYAEARATFQNAIGQHPEISLGYYALAQCDLKDGRAQDAETVLNDALVKAPGDAKIDFLNGVVLSQLGKNDQAIAALKRSIALNDHVANSHYELGKLLAEDGQLQPAKNEFEQAIALAPNHANAFYQLSKIYSRLGDKAAADKMARRTQELLAQSRANALQQQKAMLGDLKSPAQR